MLTVQYASASEFVEEYVSTIAVGGVFVAGIEDFDLHREVDVELVVERSTWTLRARPVYVVDTKMAQTAGLRHGTGMEITKKPQGFDAAMSAHLMKLGKRREVAVMVGDVPGAARLGDAGFKLMPLESVESFAAVILDALTPVIAVVAPASFRDAYFEIARSSGLLLPIFSSARVTDIDDIVNQIDRALGGTPASPQSSSSRSGNASSC